MRKWWKRNSDRNTPKEKQKYSNGKHGERPRSFDESILVAHMSSGNLVSSTESRFLFSGSSTFPGSLDLDIRSDQIVEKKAYPLPRPSLDNNIAMFGSDTSMLNLSTYYSSVSSTSTNDGHKDFGSFRVVEDTNFSSWSRSLCSGSKTSTIQTSPRSPLSCEVAFYNSPETQVRGHPCHRLPLPPDSPIKGSQNLKPKWKKGKLLGRGTFGHVYAGFNSENGQMCAIKEVRLIYNDQNTTECFKQLNQEILLLSELSHPNIVQYYGSQLGGDKLEVYLEYVSGGSINKLLREYGPFTEPLIRNYTKQILSGIAYLHGRNTVHRDIKGANILVGSNGEIKLVDFGMAKHTISCSSMLSFKGTPHWMAPEVILNNGGYGLAVDIWSLGCTIIEMATSKAPWSKYEGVAAIFKIANSKESPEIPNHLSEDAESFVKLCLQRDPSARPTAAQLLHHPFIQTPENKRI